MRQEKRLARMIVRLAAAAIDQVVNFSRCCVAPQKRLDVGKLRLRLAFSGAPCLQEFSVVLLLLRFFPTPSILQNLFKNWVILR
jgi:hypothetical protein